MVTVSEMKTRERPFLQKKGELSLLRSNDLIPAIVYGGDKDPDGISISLKDFLKELTIPGIRSRVFSLSSGQKAVIKEIQFHPVSDAPLHIDFYRVTDKSVVNVRIPINVLNRDKSPGIKRGGVLNMTSHFIELSVSVESIPESISVDLDGLEVGKSVYFRDLDIPANAKPVSFRADDTVVTVVAPSGLTSADEEGESEEETASDSKE